MASLPRLPVAIEHRVVKFFCGLPPRVQRLLFGRLPVIDGQQLAPDIHTLLWLDRLVDDDGLTEKRSVEETRAERRKEARIVAQRPPIAMARVEPVVIPGPAGQIDARLDTGLGAPATRARRSPAAWARPASGSPCAAIPASSTPSPT